MFSCMSAESEKPAIRVTGREHWEDPLYVTKCHACNVDFGVFTWRHNCRVCGHVFCDTCSSHRIEVNRPHYASAEETKSKRVCEQCFLNKEESRKILESVKEPNRAPCSYLKKAEHSPLAVSGVPSFFSSQTSEAPRLIGLPSVTITGVGEDHFFFEPDEWSMMIGANTSKVWTGKVFDVVQLRERERVWSGSVVVKRAGGSCFGKRNVDSGSGQWLVGDKIVRRSRFDSVQASWKLNDTILLCHGVSMIDDTILRLDSERHSSVSKAIKALNDDFSLCQQGVCIVYSSSQEEYYLLAREDQKHEGLRLFAESRAWNSEKKVSDICDKREFASF